jgi:hypothetical protein
MVSFDQRIYIVLTGDVVASRQVRDREALQVRLEALLARLNREHRAGIAVPFAISGGDEFQGVLHSAGEWLAIVRAVQRTLFPVRTRSGLGIGSVSTGLRQRPQEMDGQAFAFSREAVEQARKNDSWLWFRTVDSTFDLSANTISLLLSALKRRWTDLHWRRSGMREEGRTEQQIAACEGVTQSAISKSLASAAYPAVCQAEENLASLVRLLTDMRLNPHDSHKEP